jgi:hypothetical protein
MFTWYICVIGVLLDLKDVFLCYMFFRGSFLSRMYVFNLLATLISSKRTVVAACVLGLAMTYSAYHLTLFMEG